MLEPSSPLASRAVARQRPPLRRLAAGLVLAGTAPAAAAGGTAPSCGPAESWVEVGAILDLNDAGSLTLEITGGSGQHAVLLTSGIPLHTILGAINDRADATGVTAEQAAGNPERVRLVSQPIGADAFVSVRQLDGDGPRLYAEPVGGRPHVELDALGTAGVTGDLDCDGHVGFRDLSDLLERWGTCPPAPSGCGADLDADGMIRASDLDLLLRHWG